MIIVCAILIFIALAFVLPPLWTKETQGNDAEVKEANVAVYRDQLRELEGDLHNGIVSQEQFDQDREEIERRLLADVAGNPITAQPPRTSKGGRGLAYLVGIALPVIAVLFYLQVANQNGRTAAQPVEEAAPISPPVAGQPGEMTPNAIEANVQALARKLEQNPNDAKGWIMLAHSYSQMQRQKDAAEAYEHATALNPNDADLWAEYALTVATINGNEMQGKPTELVNKALAIDPQNRKALALAAEAAFKAKDYSKAIDYWQKILKNLPPDSGEVEQSVNERIAEAKRLAKGEVAK